MSFFGTEDTIYMDVDVNPVTADSKYTIILAKITSENELTSVTANYEGNSVEMALSNVSNTYYALINFPYGESTVTVSATDGINSVESDVKVITKTKRTNANYGAIQTVMRMHNQSMKGQYILGGYWNSDNEWVNETLELEIDITGSMVHISRSRLQFDIGGQYQVDDTLLYSDYNLKEGSIVTYSDKEYRILEKRDDTVYIAPFIYVIRDIKKDVANDGGIEILS